MTDLRDTKFSGFAKLLCDDMFNNFVVMSEERRHFMEAAMPIFERIIAQRAYDLVHHTIESLWPYINADAVEPSPADIPDLTQWPDLPDSE